MEEPVSRAAARREAVMSAAAAAFFELGFEATTTAEIARRAKTSKRALYEFFRSKEDILAELIRTASRQMSAPLELSAPNTREEMLAILEAFGRRFLSELFDPRRVAMYRLAMSEVLHSGEVARELDENGRKPVIAALTAIMTLAVERGLLPASDVEIVLESFTGVLTGDNHMRLLLGVLDTPAEELVERRVRLAVEAARRSLAAH